MSKNVQIKDIRGNVIFEYEKENNTIKDTLEEGVRQGISFSRSDLRHADLSEADLRMANLSEADLHRTKLYSVNLSEADLRGADLSNVYLWYANLSGADLSEAYLLGANLWNANLIEANLSKANLSNAYLCEADLRGADLSKVDLRGADVSDVNLNEAKNVHNLPMACPSEGSFIGWKKVYNYLVQLEIPEDAKRSSATTKKCRCSKAKILSITDLDGNNPIDEIVNNNYNPHVTYKVGEMVYPDSFDEVRWNECSHGIHFFVKKEEAINYNFS